MYRFHPHHPPPFQQTTELSQPFGVFESQKTTDITSCRQIAPTSVGAVFFFCKLLANPKNTL